MFKNPFKFPNQTVGTASDVPTSPRNLAARFPLDPQTFEAAEMAPEVSEETQEEGLKAQIEAQRSETAKLAVDALAASELRERELLAELADLQNKTSQAKQAAIQHAQREEAAKLAAERAARSVAVMVSSCRKASAINAEVGALVESANVCAQQLRAIAQRLPLLTLSHELAVADFQAQPYNLPGEAFQQGVVLSDVAPFSASFGDERFVALSVEAKAFLTELLASYEIRQGVEREISAQVGHLDITARAWITSAPQNATIGRPGTERAL